MSNEKPDEFLFAPDDLTLGELCELEDLTGEPAMFALASRSAKALRGVVFLLRRRREPEFTYEQTAGLKLVDIDFPKD